MHYYPSCIFIFTNDALAGHVNQTQTSTTLGSILIGWLCHTLHFRSGIGVTVDIPLKCKLVLCHYQTILSACLIAILCSAGVSTRPVGLMLSVRVWLIKFCVLGIRQILWATFNSSQIDLTPETLENYTHYHWWSVIICTAPWHSFTLGKSSQRS
jgi:hypothetical protein